MSYQFSTVHFEDIQNHKCTKEEEQVLLDTLERTVKRMATTLSRRSFYELEDFAMASLSGCEKFNLEVTRLNYSNEQSQYTGMFRHEDRFIYVLVTLEKE